MHSVLLLGFQKKLKKVERAPQVALAGSAYEYTVSCEGIQIMIPSACRIFFFGVVCAIIFGLCEI